MRTNVTKIDQDCIPGVVTPPERTTLKSFLESQGKVVEEAYNNFRPKAVSYAIRKGNPNPEDFAHDTFLAGLAVYIRVNDNLEGILHRRMVWDQCSGYRAESRSPIVRSILPEDESESEECVFGQIEQKEIQESVLKALAGLNLTQRTVLLLSGWEELSDDQIATKMGKTNQAVRSQLFRARQRMRILLTAMGYGK